MILNKNDLDSFLHINNTRKDMIQVRESVWGTNKAMYNICLKAELIQKAKLLETIHDLIKEYVITKEVPSVEESGYYVIDLTKMPKNVCKEVKLLSKKVDKELKRIEEDKANKHIEKIRNF